MTKARTATIISAVSVLAVGGLTWQFVLSPRMAEADSINTQAMDVETQNVMLMGRYNEAVTRAQQAPEVAAERLRCRNCPRVMSLGCARLVTRPRMGWQCPQHHCKSCNRTASEAGGLMFRCVGCPTAFCAECNGETPFDAVEANAEWEALGFYLPKSFEYVRCGDCLAKGEEEAKETPAKGGGGSAKKQRRR